MRIFLSDNHVPFLLDDLHYALYECNENRGGNILCCAQLLYDWLKSHMPEEGLFVSKDLKPSHKLVSLTSGHVKWYIREWETKDIIISIGDFPNVPLIVTRGCINYIHVLSLRQHGYPMDGSPRDKALETFILHSSEADHLVVKNIKRLWQVVVRKCKRVREMSLLVNLTSVG